jgi:phosphatidylserine decarboxylase
MIKNAWNFIAPAWIVALACVIELCRGHLWLGPVAGLALLFSAFCGWFFRSPARAIPADPDVLVSPADGKVIAIEPLDDAWLGKGVEIRIFLNVFNVHVQRSPFTGAALVEGTRYFAGKFLAASVPKASLENEQHWFRISSGPRKVVVKQIAGLIARRIIPWARPGDTLKGGQLIGLIQFGSQVDLGLNGAEVLVKVGDVVVGGETVLARYPAAVSKAGSAAKTGAKSGAKSKSKAPAKSKSRSRTGGR